MSDRQLVVAVLIVHRIGCTDGRDWGLPAVLPRAPVDGASNSGVLVVRVGGLSRGVRGREMVGGVWGRGVVGGVWGRGVVRGGEGRRGRV